MSDAAKMIRAMERVVEAGASRPSVQFMNDVRGVQVKVQSALAKENATRLFTSLALEIEDEEVKKMLVPVAELSVNDAIATLEAVSNKVQAKVIEQANRSNIGSFGLTFEVFVEKPVEGQKE